MKLRIILFLSFMYGICNAQINNNEIKDMDDIIEVETSAKVKEADESHYASVWSRKSFFNISSNSVTFMSSNFPTKDGVYFGEFDSSAGIGIQVGHTYDFHKKALGGVVFLGLDYTWLDLNYAQFKHSDEAPDYVYNDYSSTGEKKYNLPWHNKKQIINYGMSVGPSLTLYPFTAIHNKYTDHFRIQIYWHIGYDLGLGIIKDVNSGYDEDAERKYAYFHGLFRTWGFNVTWKSIGFGYESRRGKNYKFQAFDEEYQTEDPFKGRLKNNRFYIQFRFK